MDNIYTLKELSKALKVNVGTLKKWCQTGYLAAFKAGREWRVTQSAVDKIIKGE